MAAHARVQEQHRPPQSLAPASAFAPRLKKLHSTRSAVLGSAGDALDEFGIRVSGHAFGYPIVPLATTRERTVEVPRPAKPLELVHAASSFSR